MIREFPKWWDLLTYDGSKSDVNVTEGLEKCVEERIRVGKEEAGTSAINQSYDKFQANQDKFQEKSPGVGTEEGLWPDKSVADHHNHLYIHTKHFC